MFDSDKDENLLDDALTSLFTGLQENFEYNKKKNENNLKKKTNNVLDIQKAKSLLNKHSKKINCNPNKDALDDDNHYDDNNNFMDLTRFFEHDELFTSVPSINKEDTQNFLKRLKPYNNYLAPINDPNQYINPPKKKKYGPYKDLRSRVTILNDLNFDDEELEKELYKYDKAREKYKNFKYPKTDRKLYFTGLANKVKKAYIDESLNICPDIIMDQRLQYIKYPDVFVKRYLNNKLSLEEIEKNNLQQLFFAIFLNNSSSDKRKRYIADYSDWIVNDKKARKSRKNDKKLYFFKINNKLLNRKRAILFEQKKRSLYRKRVQRLSFKYKNIIHLTNEEISKMIELLSSYDKNTKTFPFLDEPHKIFKNANSDIEKGKAYVAYYRKQVKKKQEKKFIRKMKWNKKETNLIKKYSKHSFNLIRFFSPSYKLRKEKLKKNINSVDIDLYMELIDSKELAYIYKSFDSIFLPIFIAAKFKK